MPQSKYYRLAWLGGVALALLIAFFTLFWKHLQADLDTREKTQAVYTKTELGQSSVFLIQDIGEFSPYCLNGCLSLDPHWYQNRVAPKDLPRSPIDFSVALGASDQAPALKIIYFIGDELLLRGGPTLRYQVNDSVSITYCLNNPGWRETDSEPCPIYYSYTNPQTGSKESVLAIEKDLYDSGNQLDNLVPGLADNRFSGTVIFAKKVTIAGEVTTGGYDLVLVVDDLEFLGRGALNTTPPKREAGTVGPYSYGFGQDGYRAGDVVILANNVIGKPAIVTTGGKGQRQADGFGIDASKLKWKRQLYQFFPSEATLQQLPFDAQRDPNFLWFIEHHVFDIEDQGRGGRGGIGGNITIVSPAESIPAPSLIQHGGQGAESAKTLPPIGPPLTDAEIQAGLQPVPQRITYYYRTAPDIVPPQVGPSPFFSDFSGIFGAMAVALHGHQNWTASQPNIHPVCNLAGFVPSGTQLNCTHQHTQRDNIVDPIPATEARRPEDDGFTLPSDADHYASRIETTQAGLITCENSPDLKCNTGWPQIVSEFFVYGKTGPDGPSTAQYQLHQVVVPATLARLGAEGNSFISPRAPPAPDSALPTITNLNYARARYAFAPRGGEILTLKADNLYRALSDAALLDRDAAFVSDGQNNPLHYNRIQKARFYYASAAYQCIDALQTKTATQETRNQNPYWQDCSYALTQLRKLDAGLNYFGFSPGFYLYVKPTAVRPYIIEMLTHVDQTRADFNSRVANLRDATLEGIDQGLEVTVRRFELEHAMQDLALAVEQLGTAGKRLDIALQRINENNQRISDAQNMIASLLDRIKAATQPPPCDALCWGEKVFKIALTIGKIVADIYSFNWGAAIGSFKNAIDAIDSAVNFVEGVRAVGEYANLLLNGKTGTVKFKGLDAVCDVNDQQVVYCNVFSDSTKALVVEDDTFKTGVVDPAKGLYTEAKNLQDGIVDLQTMGDNPLAQNIAQIRNSADYMSGNLQENLTQIYQLQAAVQDNPLAYALARSLEDQTKGLQGFNRAIPEFQRQHVEAALDAALLDITRLMAENQTLQAQKILDLQAQALLRADDALAHSETMLDSACRKARVVNDRYLLTKYLYERALAYLTLAGASNSNYNRNILIDDDYNQMVVTDDTAAMLDEFVRNSLHPEQQAQVITDVIAPARYQVSVIAGAGATTYQFAVRDLQSMKEAVCPAATLPCSLTKVAYHDDVVSALRQNGRASWEFYPWSRADFRSLPESARRSWNLGFTNADDTYYRMRVMDVAARVLLEDWTLPDPSVVSRISLSHGPEATFRLPPTGELRDYYFSREAATSVCLAVQAVTGTDLGCSSVSFFTRQIDSPFAEAVSNYRDLSTISVGTFEQAAMYGTSVRGMWTIDITNLLAQLQTYQEAHPEYNGCSQDDPCTVVEGFWRKFRGIEIKVFWAPIH